MGNQYTTPWSREEEDYLRRGYQQLPNSDIAESLGKTKRIGGD